MDFQQIKTVVFIIILTLLSGWGDAKGFIHASNIWEQGRLVMPELVKSAFWYSVGIITFWLVIRPLKEVGIVTPEIQTIGWFAVTIVGVALISGKFLQWQIQEQVISVAVILGIGWLLFKTSI